MANARRESRWAGAHVWDVPAHLVPIEGARRGVLRITRDASVAETLHSGMAREAAIGFTADVIHLPAIAQAELPPNLVPGLVRIAWDGGSPDGRIPELLRVGACLDLVPSDGALDALVECSEGGVMCRLVDLAAWTTATEALASSLEHYLTSPRLEAPIEPWHSIARGIASRRPRDLSGTYDETLRRNYWLGEDGSVSLSGDMPPEAGLRAAGGRRRGGSSRRRGAHSAGGASRSGRSTAALPALPLVRRLCGG